MKKNLIFIFLLVCVQYFNAQEKYLDLSGAWNFKIDRQDVGVKEKWYNFPLEDTIVLPGSMNTNGKGDEVSAETPWIGSTSNKTWYTDPSYAKYRTPGNTKFVFWLSPDKYYTGVAWYQKKVTIPKDWKNKSIVFELERCHWETTLWLNDRLMGMQNSLSTPHQYVLSGLKPGEYTLTLRIDNRIKDINPGPDAHSISDNTQSNWNGAVGKIGLKAKPALAVSSVKITPDIPAKKIKAEIKIENITPKTVQTELTLQARQINNSQGNSISNALVKPCKVTTGENIISLEYDLGNKIALWDEFNPNVYTLEITLSSKYGVDRVKENFGLRQLGTQGTQITVNGRPIFIRGTLECCIFPKTGFPPTDVSEWERIMRIAKAHGLNHLRFHSWCPPKAAFEAADRLGVYLYVECAAWCGDLGNGKPIDQYVMDESNRIIQEYGNHPSFCLFSYGNEPGGKGHVKYLTRFVQYWKEKDSRFLYTTAAGWPAIAESDWLCLPAPRIQSWGGGIKSIINSSDPGSDYDWSERISKTQPTVSHEIGQWCVYPDLKERAKYTGAFKAKNFDIFEDRLQENGLLHLADSFLWASGKLQALCYKADIEAALRTKGFGGFQLLDLHDFPGQGTALVGVLNPFWESKGYITPEEYSRFCNEIVPLARIKRFILTSGDALDASIEIAQFGPKDLLQTQTKWTLKDAKGKIVDSGTFTSAVLPTGTLTQVGRIQKVMHTSRPQQYSLTVSLGKYSNDWDIWVYPQKEEKAEDILVTSVWDETCQTQLEKGGKVLLTPTFGSLKNEGRDSVVVGFSSIFWNTMWTHNQAPHTLGILCNPQHPALAEFPTAYYSNYQWQDAMSHCQAIPLKKLGNDIQPIVRIIDDWFTARSLGMMVEMKIGKGKLLLCSADLLTDTANRPEARQLKNSLLNYMKSNAFNPSQSVPKTSIKALFK